MCPAFSADICGRAQEAAGPSGLDPLFSPLVLVVEDHPDMARRLRDGLTLQGFRVEWVPSLRDALQRLGQEPPVQLLVLDLSLPDADGLEAVQAVRALDLPEDPPVLVLTVYRDLDLRVRALEAGADDFLVKPFAMEELVARLRALGRRGRADRRRPRKFGPLLLDPRDRTVRLGDRQLILTMGEFAVLWRIATRGGGPASPAALGLPDPGDPLSLSEGAVRVLIHRLRRKLAQAFGHRVQIRSVRPEGYRLEVQE